MGLKHPFAADLPVFIVDDDSSVRDALSLLLKIEGFVPRGFGDGLSFLEVVQDNVPACVVMDINLPGRTGLELLEDIFKLRFPPPVIVITGQADIAMAVALRPRLLLMDEPTSGVAAAEKMAIVETLVRVLREAGVTAVFVEHDMEVVGRFADRVAVWGQGKIAALGTPSRILNDPEVQRTVIGIAPNGGAHAAA